MTKILSKKKINRKKSNKIPSIWNRVAGLLKDRKYELESHSKKVRKEWEKESI